MLVSRYAYRTHFKRWRTTQNIARTNAYVRLYMDMCNHSSSLSSPNAPRTPRALCRESMVPACISSDFLFECTNHFFTRR